MIIPAPNDLRAFGRFPLTWTLLALNVLIFVMIFNGRPETYANLKILQNDGIEVTGRLYQQYSQGLPASELSGKPKWIHDIRSTNSEQMETLGAYAIRDRSFLDAAETLPFHGDSVRIDQWRAELGRFKNSYFTQAVFLFGLHSFEKQKLTGWITYQFAHSGWIHLISNMLFLVIMGAAVETIAGSWALILVYIFGGMAGGLAFLLLNAHGAVPMVGASAAVSALLAFYCVVEKRKRIRYLYFISPFLGQNGFIYLPTLLIFPLFLLVDFGNLMSTPDGMGSGVAYSAHIGGTLFGLLSGALFFVFSRLALKRTVS